MTISLLFVVALAMLVIGILYRHFRLLRREQFIREAVFPKGLLQKLLKKHPKLDMHDAHLVSKALRQYFLTYHLSKYRYVSMPSEVVDDLWHEFILYTRNYELFCKRAFGQFFHHSPAVVIGANRQSNNGLRRTWWFACKEENINPKNAVRLPLLFAIDAKLNIENGRVYALNCAGNSHLQGGDTCCVGDFSNGSSGCGGGSDGWRDVSGDVGGNDGAGDSGCGGGCGGD